jgi:hypothetical protein
MSVHWTPRISPTRKPALGREQDRHPVGHHRGAEQLLHVVGLDREDRRVLGFAAAHVASQGDLGDHLVLHGVAEQRAQHRQPVVHRLARTPLQLRGRERVDVLLTDLVERHVTEERDQVRVQGLILRLPASLGFCSGWS